MKNLRFLSLFFAFLLLLNLMLPLRADAADIQVAAEAALLVERDSGEVLYAQNHQEQLYPAGLTSLMTALLVMEAIEDGVLALEDNVEITAAPLEQVPPGSSTAELRAGEQLTITQLLSCILVVSAADASNVLACQVSGTVDAFVELMNRRAEELGCENTCFTNPHGVHNAAHYTTAWDLWLIANEAMRHEALVEIADQSTLTLPASEVSKQRIFYTTNSLLSQFRLLGYLYPRAQGLKAAQTPQAGYCLATSAIKGDTTLVCVILGAQRVKLEDGAYQTQSFSEAKRLCEWGFANFSRKLLLTGKEAIGTVPVTLSKNADQVVARPAHEVTAILPNELDPEGLTYTIAFNAESLPAPVTAGDSLGWLTLSAGEKDYATVELVAAADVEPSQALLFRQEVLLFLEDPKVQLAGIGLIVLLLLLIICRLLARRRRRSTRGSFGHRGQYRGKKRIR